MAIDTTNKTVAFDPTGINGPLASLNSPGEYDFQYRQYPLHNFNAGQSLASSHYVVFYINQQNNTQYANKSGPTVASGQISKIDQLARTDGLLKGEISNIKDKLGKTIGGSLGEAIQSDNFSLLRKTTRLKYAVALYTPDTITFGQKNQYAELGLTDVFGIAGAYGQAGAAGLDVAGGIISGNGTLAGGLKTSVPFAAEVAGSVISNNNTKFGRGFGDVRSAALFSLGYALNPQMEVIYSTPSFRQFRFTFLMTPDSKKEAEVIREIIKTFRYHAAPEFVKAALGRYMIPPSEFDIEFMRGSQRNNALPQISTCVLNAIDVDYTPGQAWSTMEDGHPTLIRMTLDFTEIDIITKQRVAQGF